MQRILYRFVIRNRFHRLYNCMYAVVLVTLHSFDKWTDFPTGLFNSSRDTNDAINCPLARSQDSKPTQRSTCKELDTTKQWHGAFADDAFTCIMLPNWLFIWFYHVISHFIQRRYCAGDRFDSNEIVRCIWWWSIWCVEINRAHFQWIKSISKLLWTCLEKCIFFVPVKQNIMNGWTRGGKTLSLTRIHLKINNGNLLVGIGNWRIIFRSL